MKDVHLESCVFGCQSVSLLNVKIGFQLIAKKKSKNYM